MQDAGQPECSSTQDGLLWLTPVEGGEEVLTQAPREPFTVPVLPVTSHRDVCMCRGGMGVSAETIVSRHPSLNLHLSELERS